VLLSLRVKDFDKSDCYVHIYYNIWQAHFKDGEGCKGRIFKSRLENFVVEENRSEEIG
jgi:hypothetical protein